VSNQEGKTAIGIDPTSQTVVIVFPEPVTQLALSPEQAEAFGNELLRQANLLRLQQSN
jgi:hypothetical protein